MLRLCCCCVIAALLLGCCHAAAPFLRTQGFRELYAFLPSFSFNETINHLQVVFGAEYELLDVSYYITAFEFLSSVSFILAIVYWRWRTNVTVERVS